MTCEEFDRIGAQKARATTNAEMAAGFTHMSNCPRCRAKARNAIDSVVDPQRQAGAQRCADRRMATDPEFREEVLKAKQRIEDNDATTDPLDGDPL